MNVAPEALFEAVIDTGTTGLAGTIGVSANDNTGTLAIPFTTSGITELAPGVYAATGLTAPSSEGQYTLIWRDGALGEVLGIEDLTVTYSAPGEPAPTAGPYATVAELATILQVNATSNAAALERVLVAAAGEINSETGRTDLAGWELELAAQVNLARAEELWRQMKAPWGLVGLDSDLGPTHIARDTFARHAHALAPLKQRWGIA